MGACLAVQDAVVDAGKDEPLTFECKSHAELATVMTTLVGMCNNYYEFTIEQANDILAFQFKVLASYVESLPDFGYVTRREVHDAFRILHHFADRSDTRHVVHKFWTANAAVMKHQLINMADCTGLYTVRAYMQ